MARPSTLFVAVLAVLPALASCGGTRSGPVTFGAAGPWTEDYGLMNRRGIELALDQINARPAWRSRPLRIEFRDDGGNGVRATAIAREFVENQAVIAVIGHVNSGAMVSAARVYDVGLPALSTTASAPAITGISPWVFRVIPSDSTNGAEIAAFAQRRGFRSVAILYENDPYGRGLTDAFRRAFTGDIITIDPISSGTENDFEPYVSYFRRKSPDAIFVAGTNVSGKAFLREARRQRLGAALVGGDGWSTLASDTAYAEGVYVGAPFTASDTSGRVRRFVASFIERYHVTPDHNAALAYDATMLLANAVERGARSREGIREFLATLDSASAFIGVTGRIGFDAGGDPVGKGIVMTRIHEGALLLETGR